MDQNIINSPFSQKIEYFLLCCFFSIIGSWLYQKIIKKEVDSDLIVWAAVSSLILYFFIIGPLLWYKPACIIGGLILGSLLTRKLID